jgi:acyl-CoA synthetase (AMP-forming)/AMP-acid ligase II
MVSDARLEAVMQRNQHGTVNTCCKVDATGGVPTIAWQLVEHPGRTRYDLSSLKSLSYGGAPSAPELARKIREEFPAAAPGTGWGMSETSATFSSPFARRMKIALRAADQPRPLVNSKKDYWNKPDETTKPSLTAGQKQPISRAWTGISHRTPGRCWLRL